MNPFLTLTGKFMNSPLRGLFPLPRGWDIRYSPRFMAYQPTFEINIKTSKYQLKTARSTKELLEVFELRYQIFLEEHQGEDTNDGYDLDQFDSICDHIIIKCQESGKIVGTYRCITSLTSTEFYGQGEFDLDEFLALPGGKLELGRACIHHGHRNGSVIDLLWRGIAEYIKLTNARYLFGCSSIKLTEPTEAKALMNFMEREKLISDEFGIRPIGKFDMQLSKVEESSNVDERTLKRMIPPLLRSYMSAGAMIYGEPALDLEFQCVDFLTILDIDKLSPSYKKRYFREMNQ